jgi:hypothetical protein
LYVVALSYLVGASSTRNFGFGVALSAAGSDGVAAALSPAVTSSAAAPIMNARRSR